MNVMHKPLPQLHETQTSLRATRQRPTRLPESIIKGVYHCYEFQLDFHPIVAGTKHNLVTCLLVLSGSSKWECSSGYAVQVGFVLLIVDAVSWSTRSSFFRAHLFRLPRRDRCRRLWNAWCMLSVSIRLRLTYVTSSPGCVWCRLNPGPAPVRVCLHTGTRERDALRCTCAGWSAPSSPSSLPVTFTSLSSITLMSRSISEFTSCTFTCQCFMPLTTPFTGLVASPKQMLVHAICEKEYDFDFPRLQLAWGKSLVGRNETPSLLAPDWSYDKGKSRIAQL